MCANQQHQEKQREMMVEEIEMRLKILEEEAKTIVEEYAQRKVLMDETYKELKRLFDWLSKDSISVKQLLQGALVQRLCQDERTQGAGLLQLLQTDLKPCNIMTRDCTQQIKLGKSDTGFTASSLFYDDAILNTSLLP